MGPRLFWYNHIAQRPEFWFGRRFWLSVFLVTALVPFGELVWLCEGDRYSAVGWAVDLSLACINIGAVALLASLAQGLTNYGMHVLKGPVLVTLVDLLARVFPSEYRDIRQAHRGYRNEMMPESQKLDVIEELVNSPYAFRIFSRYISRVCVVVVTIPFYLGIAMLSLKVVPDTHEIRERGGLVEVVGALQVVRDIEMGVLGGSSTEHDSRIEGRSRREFGVESPTRLVTRNKRADQSAVPRRPEVIRPWAWRLVAWEIGGILSSVVYVLIALVLLPWQFGIASGLDDHLKSRSFWKDHLLPHLPRPEEN
jgi:hypothetical protein